MGRTPGPGTTYICGAHRLTVKPGTGETPLEHIGGNAGLVCTSQVYIVTVRRQATRAEVLAAMAGEDGEAVCPKCGTSSCLEDKALDW